MKKSTRKAMRGAGKKKPRGSDMFAITKKVGAQEIKYEADSMRGVFELIDAYDERERERLRKEIEGTNAIREKLGVRV